MLRYAALFSVLLFTTACSPLELAVMGLTKGLSQYAAYAPLLAQGGNGVLQGIASWYGPGFAGNRTASGEVFNPSDLTAAHRSLPFGTRVRVTNTRSGASVVVRINDRGPHIAGRVIDLSQGAAAQIGLVRSGTAEVRLEVVSDLANAPAPTAAPAVQAAAAPVQPVQAAAPAAPATLRVASAEDLRTYDVVASRHPQGELLLLSSPNSDETLMVRVVSNTMPEGTQADLVVSAEMYALLGERVTVLQDRH